MTWPKTLPTANGWALRLEARMRIRNFCTALMLASAIGSPAYADDFCANLKTALAAARTGFTHIPGPEDDVGWREVKLALPYATDCYVEPDKRFVSYFCFWKKEQSGAVNARYKYTVRQTDQCLAGFRKTVGDMFTTWRNPAIGTVTVDARHVMKNAETWSLMLKVER